MGFWASLLGGIATAAAAVFQVVVRVASDIVQGAAEMLDRFAKGDNVDAAMARAARDRDVAQDKLIEVNNELLALLDKNARTNLSTAERRRADHLQQERSELRKSISGVEELVAAQEIVEEPDAFEKFTVRNDRAHLIQGQVGVSAFGKKCPRCGRDMILQWPRGLNSIKTEHFFWGCSGWYQLGAAGQRACQKTLQLSSRDLQIFARTDAPEAKMSNSALSELVLMPEASQVISERLDDSMADLRRAHKGIDAYRCPTHGEPLVLRKKKQAGPLLDQYFLGCPRWRPNNQGCGYIVKLKSPMQLSTLLKKQTGAGLL